MTRALSALSLLLCLAIAGCAMDGSPLPAEVADDEAASQETQALAGSAVFPGAGPGAAATCGDGVCTPGVENCGTCPGDCPCWQQGTFCSSSQCVPVCGDGLCVPGQEDCGTCAVDCPCAPGTVCQNRQCVLPDPCGGDICCRKPWLCE